MSCCSFFVLSIDRFDLLTRALSLQGNDALLHNGLWSSQTAHSLALTAGSVLPPDGSEPCYASRADSSAETPVGIPTNAERHHWL